MKFEYPPKIQISGYGGFVPSLEAENVHGYTYVDAQRTAASIPRGLFTNVPNPKMYDPTLTMNERPRARRSLDSAIQNQISGYGGFVAGIESGNIYAKSFWPAQSQARNTYSKTATSVYFKGRSQDSEKIGQSQPDDSLSAATEPDPSQLRASASISPPPLTYDEPRKYRARTVVSDDVHVTGYSGYVPKIMAQNIHAKVHLDAQLVAKRVKPESAPARTSTSSFALTLHNALMDAHDSALYRPSKARPEPLEDTHIAGYSGYVPRVYPRNLHGSTFQRVQREANTLAASIG